MKRDVLEAFVAELEARMAKGHIEYGDRSWSKDPETLVREVMEEAVDIAGWGMILWARLHGVLRVLNAIKAETKPKP